MHGEASCKSEKTANRKEGDQGCSVHIYSVPNGQYNEPPPPPKPINTNTSVSMKLSQKQRKSKMSKVEYCGSGKF